jgi:hypothetical protein
MVEDGFAGRPIPLHPSGRPCTRSGFHRFRLLLLVAFDSPRGSLRGRQPDGGHGSVRAADGFDRFSC